MSKPSDLLQGTLNRLLLKILALEPMNGFAEWKTSEYGRRAKYYSLTPLGRGQLEKEAENGTRLSGAVSKLIKLNEV